jgi:pimeloyl-ACP methyl ester carboxylesterase
MKSGYIDLRGHQVWSAQWRKPLLAKDDTPVLLLHGGLSSTDSWSKAILPAVKTHAVFAYDRTAHGRTGSRDGFYHFDFQTDEAIAYLEDVMKGPAHLVGWSDGGIIALLVAIKRPDLVKSIVAIGTNYHHDCGLIINEEENQEINISEEDAAHFAKTSPDPAHMQELIIRRAYDVWAAQPTMTTQELATIACPVLVLNGDDEPFSMEHTASLYESLPDGRLAIIPGASHFAVKEKPGLVVPVIKDFLAHLDYPVTKWPNRRRIDEAGEK